MAPQRSGDGMLCFRFVVCALLGVIGGQALAGDSGATVAALKIEDVLNLRTFPAVTQYASMTGDGRWVAYAVRNATDWPRTTNSTLYSEETGVFNVVGRGTQIWVVDSKSGLSRTISSPGSTEWGPVWSPDGSRLAFYSDRDGLARLWIWNRQSNRFTRVTEVLVRPMYKRPTWSPDGSQIAVWVMPQHLDRKEVNASFLADNQAAVEKTGPGPRVRVLRSSAASADAAQAAVASSGAVVDANRIDPSTTAFPDALADLALIDLKEGNLRRVVTRKAPAWYSFSPDGAYLAYVDPAGYVVGAIQAVGDIYVVPAQGGPPRRLTRHSFLTESHVAWAPDSRSLAFRTSGQLADGAVHVIDVASGTERRLTSEGLDTLNHDDYTRTVWVHWSKDSRRLFFTSLGHLWAADVRKSALRAITRDGWGRDAVSLVTNEDRSTVSGSSDSVIVATLEQNGRRSGFYRIEVDTGEAVKLREEPRYYSSQAGGAFGSADGSTILYISEDARSPPDLWIGKMKLASSRQITRLNPNIQGAALGDSRVIDFRGSDGQVLHGALLLPANYKRGIRYPLLVWVYPRMNTANGAFRFGLLGAGGTSNMQLLASRGYAVLDPDIPRRVGTPMHDIASGVHLAVNKVIDMGIADPDRLGILGESYGGYSTMAVIVQTPRFKAAVMVAGFADLMGPLVLGMRYGGKHGYLPWAETGQGMMGGSPWQYRSRYIENSPIFYLDRVSTPLLIIHGDEDIPQNADQIFVGLHRLGKEVEYRMYSGVGHSISGTENLIDYWSAVQKWFSNHLSPSQVTGQP